MRFLLAFVLLATSVATAHAHFGARFEPPDGTIYHGCGWNGYDSQAYYNSMFPPSHHPLILQVVAGMPGTRDMDVERVIQSLTAPIVHADSQYVEYGLHFQDRFGMLDSVFALTTTLDRYIDTLAIAFLAVDRPFFLRIGFEFNGAWNPYHPYIFPLAFRKLVTELRVRGVDNFATVWCYEPDAPADFADSNAQGWKWYPGDDIVDWFGLDPFDVEHFDPDLPDTLRGEITRKGKTEAFLRFADERRKPVFLNELSARHVYIVPDSLDPGHAQGQADWEYWFAPFFRFVRNHPNIKGWNYINLDWTRYETYATWGDARLEINSFIRDRWVDSLMTERFLNVGYDVTQSESVSDLRSDLPHAIELSAYPNPFNSATRITLNLPIRDYAEIALFNALGQRVNVLHSGVLSRGNHAFPIDGGELTSGSYFVRVTQSGATTLQRIVLIR
ncbi:T9SS type A sorting domain-containing protein [bacterium]|nr:T9SS type A sorting domain-containing protein [bacterium]